MKFSNKKRSQNPRAIIFGSRKMLVESKKQMQFFQPVLRIEPKNSDRAWNFSQKFENLKNS